MSRMIMDYQEYKLPNQASLYLVPQKDAKSVTVLVMYPIGSRYEQGRLSGVSHYIEHLMFKGTKKRPNTLTLTREIDRLGAEYNAFTSKEYTGYYIKSDSKYLDVSLDILSDMLFNSLFDSKEMEKEKGVIVEEIRMYKDNPLMNIGNIFESLMYAGNLGRDIAGTEKHVLGYQRKDVLNYRNKYYQPNNMTVVVAGKVDDKTKQLVNKYFGKRKNKSRVTRAFLAAKFGKVEKDKRVGVEQKQTDQAQMMLGFPGLDYNHRNNPVLTVLNTILGGSMSSRLFIKIRERLGLAYLVKSGAENFRDTGYAYVRVGLEAKNINKTLQVVKQEIEKIKKHGVTKKELADAKTHLRGALTLAMEDSSAQASWYAGQALFMKSIKTPEEKLRGMEKVTNADIKAMAKKVFNFQQMRVAVIGNVNKKDIIF